jgi:hypothetical protein
MGFATAELRTAVVAGIQEIGTFVVKPDGSGLNIRDFAPLIVPTPRLLEYIAKEGGPNIPPDSIFGEFIGVPLFTIERTFGVGVRLVVESSAVPEHASALQGMRVRELQSLFSRFAFGSQEQREELAARPDTSAAARLMAMILAAAFGLAAGKSEIKRTADYEVRAVWLRETDLQ